MPPAEPEADDGRIPAAPGLPAWPWATSVLCCLAGIGVSIYLTIVHYDTAVSLACPESGVINCQKVTTSPESEILGIPVAVLGLAFFAGMLLLSLPQAWRSPSPLVRPVRLVAAAVGVAFVAWFVYVELFRLDAICLYCTVVHALSVLLFGVIVIAYALYPAGGEPDLEDEDEDGAQHRDTVGEA